MKWYAFKVYINQDDLTNDDDAEFWESVEAIEDNKLIKVIVDKQLVFPLEEVPSAPKPKRSKTAHFHNLKLVEWM